MQKSDPMRYSRYIIVVIFLLVHQFIQAQQSLTLFYMHDDPHANLVNPALQPNCKLYIGIPVLSSIHINLHNTGFSYRDLGKGEVDINRLVKKSHWVDFTGLELHINLLAAGYRWKDYYFNFNLNEKVEAKIFYPNTLIKIFDKGNYAYLDKKAKIGNLGVNAVHYREYAFGASKLIDDGFWAGLKMKLLFGKSDIQTLRRQSYLYTDAETYQLRFVTDLAINASGPFSVTKDADNAVTGFEADKFNPLGYMLNRRNWGLATDFGVVYPVHELVNVEASLLDVGFIRWVDGTHKITQSGTFQYNGIDLNFQGAQLESGDFLSNLVDSLNQFTKFYEKPGNYFIMLNPKLYAGATFLIADNLYAGALSYTAFYPRRPVTSIALTVNTRNYKVLNASLGYNINSGGFNGIGFGFTAKFRSFQMHMITDNLTLAIRPSRARDANFRFGFNLMFGCKKAVKKKSKYEIDDESTCGCRWSEEKKYEKMKKRKFKIFNK